MVELFYKINVGIPNQPSPRVKRKSLLHSIGGGWYVEKLGHRLPPLKKIKLIKISQKEENKIQRRLTEANQEWNDWKFQMGESKEF